MIVKSEAFDQHLTDLAETFGKLCYVSAKAKHVI